MQSFCNVMKRILVVNDMVLTGSHYEQLLADDLSFEVFQCLEDKKCVASSCGKVSPDIIITSDFSYTKHSYSDIIGNTKCIIVTSCNYSDEKNELPLKKLKKPPVAYAFISPYINAEDFKLVVRSILSDIFVIQKNILDYMDDKSYMSKTDEVQISQTTAVISDIQLSKNEMVIIRHIIDGKSNKSIAENMFLSEGRVKNIVSNILKKFKLEDRTQLAVYSIKNGIVGNYTENES